MEDIIINGVSINDLKEKRKQIQPGSAELISNNIDKVKQLVSQIIEAESWEQVEELSKQAYELLDTAKIVSDISGVAFDLPYYEEYGRYDYNETLSGMLEDGDNENVDVYDGGYLGELFDLLGGMEIQCRDWYSSRC